LRVVFVRLRIAKVDQQAVAQILRNIPVEALDHVGAGLLVYPHHVAPVFRIELSGETGRVYQIAEQHGELAAFGVGRTRWGWGGRRLGRGGILSGRLGRWLGGVRGRGRSSCSAMPDEDFVVFID